MHAYDLVVDQNNKAPRVILGSPTLNVLVCAHDCDIENMRDRRGLLVTPIVEEPSFEQEQRERLRRSHSTRRDANGNRGYDFVHLFPLRLTVDGEETFRVADFSGMMSVGGKLLLDKLCPAKTHEMDDRHRRKLQLKLSAFVSRQQDARPPLSAGSAVGS
jgi:hypothetical protein